jgi:hypothetical protein
MWILEQKQRITDIQTVVMLLNRKGNIYKHEKNQLSINEYTWCHSNLHVYIHVDIIYTGVIYAFKST